MDNLDLALTVYSASFIVSILILIASIYLGARNIQVYIWRMRWIKDCGPYMGRLDQLYPELLDYLDKHSYHSMIWKFWNRTYESAMGGWTPATYAEHLLQERAKKQAEAEKPPV